MASDKISQVLIASEPDFLNLVASSGRVPSGSGLSFVGLPCANPEFTGEIEVAENEATSNKFFKRAPVATLRRGSVAFDLYLRSVGMEGDYSDPQFKILDACFGKQVTTANSYTVDTWEDATVVVLTSVASLAVGSGFAVVVGGVKHVRFVTNIQQAQKRVTFAPALPATVVSEGPEYIYGGRTYAIGRNFKEDSSLAAQLRKEAYMVEALGLQGSAFDLPLETGKMATAKVTLRAGYYNAVADAEAVGATSEPSGTWLKFLNADCFVAGEATAVRSAKWSIQLGASAVQTPSNAAGLSAWEMGAPEIAASLELSAFDSTYPLRFEESTEFSVLCTLGTPDGGSAVAIYCPAMHIAKFPEPGSADDLTTLPLELRAGNTEADDGTFSSAEDSVVDTIFRLFYEAGPSV